MPFNALKKTEYFILKEISFFFFGSTKKGVQIPDKQVDIYIFLYLLMVSGKKIGANKKRCGKNLFVTNS